MQHLLTGLYFVGAALVMGAGPLGMMAFLFTGHYVWAGAWVFTYIFTLGVITSIAASKAVSK